MSGEPRLIAENQIAPMNSSQHSTGTQWSQAALTGGWLQPKDTGRRIYKFIDWGAQIYIVILLAF